MKAWDNALNAAAGHLCRWVYPAQRPALVPFKARQAVANKALKGLVALYSLGGWLERGIGVVDPDIAKRNGIKGVER